MLDRALLTDVGANGGDPGRPHHQRSDKADRKNAREI